MIQEQESFNKYFHDIKKIWSKLSHPNRIIPFCTPLIKNPNFLVIGKNHSNNFDPFDDDKNNKIADAFSKEIAKENTFIEHSHSFAKGINRVVSEINEEHESFFISKKWIGTNRCAIQTDSKGLGEIPKHPKYEECQKDMDKLLRNLIQFLKPKNVILSGVFACNLFYREKSLQDMRCKRISLGKDSNQTFNLIPVEHFSMNYNTKKIVDRISDAIRTGYCDF